MGIYTATKPAVACQYGQQPEAGDLQVLAVRCLTGERLPPDGGPARDSFQSSDVLLLKSSEQCLVKSLRWV